MKFSIRQILASAAGAVIAAVIASTFGVKGTIVGVAIGSAAATMATALVAQSIERGHEAVKQVVVRAPEASTLLRKLGGTGASGGTATSAETAPTQVVGRSAPEDGGRAETVQMESVAAPVGETERLEISATADAPATERLRADHDADAAGRHPARRTTILLANHRGDSCHRLRAGPRVHYSHRIDLGQTVVGDLRWIGYRDHTEQPRWDVGCTHHHADVDAGDDVDHLDLDLDFVHVHDHDDVRHEHDEHDCADRQLDDDDDLARVVDHHHGRRGCDIDIDIDVGAVSARVTSP